MRIFLIFFLFFSLAQAESVPAVSGETSQRGLTLVEMKEFAPIEPNSILMVRTKEGAAKVKVVKVYENRLLIKPLKGQNLHLKKGQGIQLLYKTKISKLDEEKESPRKKESYDENFKFSFAAHLMAGLSKPIGISDVSYAPTFSLKFFYEAFSILYLGAQIMQAKYSPKGINYSIQVQRFGIDLGIPAYVKGNFIIGAYGGYFVSNTSSRPGITWKNYSQAVDTSAFEERKFYGGLFSFWKPYRKLGFRLDLGLDSFSLGVGGFF